MIRMLTRIHSSSLSLALFFACAPAAAFAASSVGDGPAGHWSGAIDTPGAKLAIEVELARSGDAWTGTISIPAQGAHDIALEKFTVKGDEVDFAIAGVPGDPNFKGKLASDGSTIAGDFLQGGAKLAFSMARAASPEKQALAALDGFDKWIDEAREAWKVPGCSVAIVQHGKLIFAKGFGLRDVDAKTPATADTLFAIGSSTKAFTTFVIGTLVDEGKLDWDKPVRTWLPEFAMHDPFASERMTPRDLVTHKSGLPRHDLLWYNSKLTRAEMVARLPYLPESKDFRTEFQYNNLMLMTSGFLAERVTGKSWEQLVKARIFDPLGMKRSNFSVQDSKKDADFAEPYEILDDKLHHMKFRDITNIGPAGAINSSANEMAKWLELQLGDGKFGGKPLIQKSTLDDIHTPRMNLGAPSPETPEVVPVGYALAWFVDDYRGHLRVHHGGNIDGFSALVALLPQDDLGFVVLTNMNAAALPNLIVEHATDRLVKLEPKDWNKLALARRDAGKATGKEAEAKKKGERKLGTSPSHPLADYAGEYEHPGYGVIKVALVGDKLKLEYNDIPGPLEHWHYDVFNVTRDESDHTFEDTKIQFTTGMDGEIEGLRTAIEPAVEDAVFKRRSDAELRDPKYLARFVGEYSIETQTFTVALQGDKLTMSTPGQPLFTLVGRRHDTFDLKGISGFSLRFNSDASGVLSCDSIQPNGVFTAKRKK